MADAGPHRRAGGAARRPVRRRLHEPRAAGRPASEHGLERPRRGVRDRAGLGDRTPPGPVRRRARRLRRPAAGQGAGAGARRAPAGHPPAAGHAGAGARGHLHDGRAGPLRRRPGRGRLRQRGAAAGLRARPRGWVARVAPGARDDPVGHLSVAHAHPRWVVEALRRGGRRRRDRGVAGRRQRAARGHAGRPSRPLDPRGAAGRADPLVAVRRPPGLGRPGRRRRRSPRAGRASRTRARSWWPSPWPSAPLDGPDERWLDLCAGPGGKAALLAALAAERGAGAARQRAAAAPRRARPTRARAAPTACSAWSPADGTRPPWPPGPFDRVLVDAPCTGLGALRRRPEARWRRQPSDLDALVPLQTALLSSALDSVRPGGVVLYATCSPVLAETAGVVAAVLAARDRRGPGGRGGPAARRTGLRRSAARAPSSSGRTGTAPTPCSVRCCDGDG